MWASIIIINAYDVTVDKNRFLLLVSPIFVQPKYSLTIADAISCLVRFYSVNFTKYISFCLPVFIFSILAFLPSFIILSPVLFIVGSTLTMASLLVLHSVSFN